MLKAHRVGLVAIRIDREPSVKLVLVRCDGQTRSLIAEVFGATCVRFTAVATLSTQYVFSAVLVVQHVE